VIGLAAVLFSLSGCETTGDPSQGGLFGWSETKAIERQQQLRDQLAVSSAEERSHRQQQESLQSNRNRLQRDVNARNQRLQALQSEITALRRAVQTGDITALEASRRADDLRGPVAAATGSGSEQLRTDFAEIDQQINLLTQ
jgi:septal ring factor EnvC (AmiA/AmiB activator)